MNNMYEILEKCLLEIEQGADVDTVLFRYPEFAEELRPILETSVKAKDMAAPEPSAEVVRRNRAKVLQRAAMMREAKVKPSSRIWFASLRRLAVTLAVVAALFISGTGFVHAASTTVPGDNLYPVKRTWEDILLLFAFNSQHREELEFEHENERLEELNELFIEGRSVKVDFAGYVTRQNGNEWRVSAISVFISPQTDLPNGPVSVGDGIRVVGLTQSDKTVLAERIELLPAGSKLPEVEDTESESEEETHEGSLSQVDEGSTSGSENEAPEVNEIPQEAPQVEETHTPEVESTHEKESFEGVLEAIDDKNAVWRVDGRHLNIRSAEIKGTPFVGAIVKVEGYQGSNGVFIVTKVEVKSGLNVGDSNNNSNDDNDKNENNDDNSGDDSNDDHKDNDNSENSGDD